MRDVGSEWGDVTFSDEPPKESRFCRRCQQTLPAYDLIPTTCAKCGEAFNPGDPESYLLFRRRSALRFWLPGFCLAIVSGVSSYAICLQSGELATALFVAVPVSFGSIIGYATRVRAWALALLGVMALTTVVVILFTLDFTGFFCGLMLGVVFVVPTLLGIILGGVLRAVLIRTGWDQQWFFPPLLVLISLPYAVQGYENCLQKAPQMESVRTEVVVEASVHDTWDALMFYEEVEHEPPWILRLALPEPVRCQGSKQNVGDIVHCLYRRGYLTKRITHREPGRVLAFDVIEQQLHFEKDVTLRDGRFTLEPISPSRTRVRLLTRYRRRLSPRWLWQPVEEAVVHTLHSHVLRGMSERATGQFHPRQPVPGQPDYPRRGREPQSDQGLFARNAAAERRTLVNSWE